MRRDLRRRSNQIVGIYVVAAGLWIVLSSAITSVIAQGTSLSPTAVEITKGLVFVSATGLVLRSAMHRWADRLAAAAEAEQQAEDDITAVARLRAAFLSSISHELRTPLTNIIGFARTIQAHHAELEPWQVEHFADRLATNSRRLEQLVLDMLEIHRPTSDDVLTLEPVHLEGMLRQIVDSRGRGHEQLRVWSPVQWVQADRRKLERIVTELVDNIARHTPPDTQAWVTASAHGGVLHITAEDDGPGIEPRIRPIATEPFVQGLHAAGLASPGLGLGLTVAARCAQAHGGELTVTAPTGGGTRIDVVLPHRGAPDATT